MCRRLFPVAMAVWAGAMVLSDAAAGQAVGDGRQTTQPASSVAQSAEPDSQSGAAGQRDHQITSDDYFTIGVIADCALSPDGTHVAYTESRWEPPAETRNTDIWVVSCSGGEVRRLTFDSANDARPMWSPDGRWIYFESARKRGADEPAPYNGKKQVWRIGAEGGEPQAVTRLAEGLSAFQLSDDGRTLYYTVADKQVEDDSFKAMREKYDGLEYGRGVVEFSELWKLDLVQWRAEKLVDDRRVIGSFAVSPDERHIAMITTPTDKLISNEGRSRVDVFDAAARKIAALPDKLWRADAPSPYGWLSGLTWSRDGSLLAFQVAFDGYPAEILVARVDAAPPTIAKIARPDGVSLRGATMAWRGDSRDLCFAADSRARCHVYCIANAGGEKPGDCRMLTGGDIVVDAFSVSRSGEKLAFVMSDLTHPPDVFVTPIESREPAPMKRLTLVNPQVETWKLPSIQAVAWIGANGDKVEGILELPPDYQPGAKLPMIVELHGGPTDASRLHMRFWIYGRVLMAARGYALLSPNYRGSTGYGDKFMTELIGHENDIEVKDILAGVDAMVERGIADPARLGVMGWSNGGYLTNCLISTTDRFKAASSGAGVFDMAMQWAAEDTPGHVINFHRGFPWDQTQAMLDSSPLYQADKIRTPTLIHVGGDDSRCPPMHSRGLFRALHEYVGTPAELVVYPGEGHGLAKYKHRKAKMEWDIQWFDQYLPLDSASKTEPPKDSRL